MRTATLDLLDSTDLPPADPDTLRRAVRAIAAASTSAAECRLFLAQLGISADAVSTARAVQYSR